MVVRASFGPTLAANLSHQDLTTNPRLAARMGHPHLRSYKKPRDGRALSSPPSATFGI